MDTDSDAFATSIIDGVKVHIFHRDYDSGLVYDITQTTDGIDDADVIVCEAETIYGIMIDAYPLALGSVFPGYHGAFHTLHEIPLDEFLRKNPEYTAAADVALSLLRFATL